MEEKKKKIEYGFTLDMSDIRCGMRYERKKQIPIEYIEARIKAADALRVKDYESALSMLDYTLKMLTITSDGVGNATYVASVVLNKFYKSNGKNYRAALREWRWRKLWIKIKMAYCQKIVDEARKKAADKEEEELARSLERAMNFEKAAELYEKHEMYGDARRCREIHYQLNAPHVDVDKLVKIENSVLVRSNVNGGE